jgi:hypothetical protein
MKKSLSSHARRKREGQKIKQDKQDKQDRIYTHSVFLSSLKMGVARQARQIPPYNASV